MHVADQSQMRKRMLTRSPCFPFPCAFSTVFLLAPATHTLLMKFPKDVTAWIMAQGTCFSTLVVPVTWHTIEDHIKHYAYGTMGFLSDVHPLRQSFRTDQFLSSPVHYRMYTILQSL